MKGKIAGFTLIELVLGMVIFAIGMAWLTSVLYPQSDKASESVHRIRATELAQSVLREIWSKRYDENTNSNGGLPACNSPSGIACSTVYGPDTDETRDDFDDVDDYNGLDINDEMLNSTETYASQYHNYEMSVSVSANSTNSKLISLIVTTPNDEDIRFDMVRSNY